MSPRKRQTTIRPLPDGEPRTVRVIEDEQSANETGGGGSRGRTAPVGEIRLDLGEAGVASVRSSSTGVWSVLTAAGSFEAEVAPGENGEVEVRIGSETFRFETGKRSASRVAGRTAARAEVRAPMPGKIVKLLAEEGSVVNAGQGVLLFEAMKMQNEVKSPQDGRLARLLVSEGETVEGKTPLFIVEGSPK